MAKEDEARTQVGTNHYNGPAGGWGSIKGISQVLMDQKPDPGVLRTLARQNKVGGHMCTSCAWTKPAEPHPFEFCENGAKATIWDLTRDRCGPEVFANHSVSEMRGWSDHALEKTGRLTHPMRYDPGTDHYVPSTWSEAFEAIGSKLRTLKPTSTVFYTSGRASLETSYLFALFARLYGHNNLPDSSNMCHETTSVALKKVIGSPVGTCIREDFDSCDMMLFFGQNTGSNSPRFLHTLQTAVKRGCRIVTFNPVRERGLVEFVNPQGPVQMVTQNATKISDIYLQVRPGGDIAAISGLCKHLLALEDTQGKTLDHGFITTHTNGFDSFITWLRKVEWAEIEAVSGLAQRDLERVADLYAAAERVIAVYGMGLTQHVHGSITLGMLTNLMLLRGNIGRLGAGLSPVRGHSNVQGQRTVGISEKPELVPLDKLAAMFGFDPPRKTGQTTVEVVEGLLDGSVRGFVSLGGNFARAIPDQGRADAAWAGLDLNVQIATKLNRSHTLVCPNSWLLPTLVRAEEDMQASGPQAVTMEDSLSHIHGSLGRRRPADPMLKSEIAIVAGIAQATLPENPSVRWEEWTGDYAQVRDLIARTYPEEFRDFDARKFTPGGFYRGNSARNREWKTESGKAEFTTPKVLSALGQLPGDDTFTLITLRSNDQFNTTIYGFSDRLRGLEGSRDIVLMNPEEMARLDLQAGQLVTLHSAVYDGTERRLDGLAVTPFDLPNGCVACYCPEANPLIPLGYHDEASKTPAYKGAPVRIVTQQVPG